MTGNEEEAETGEEKRFQKKDFHTGSRQAVREAGAAL